MGFLFAVGTTRRDFIPTDAMPSGAAGAIWLARTY